MVSKHNFYLINWRSVFIVGAVINFSDFLSLFEALTQVTILTEAIAHHPSALRENSNILTNPMPIVIVFERSRDQIWKMLSWKVSTSRRERA